MSSVLSVCDTLQLRFIPVYRTIWGKVQILHLMKRVGKACRTACLRKRLVNPLHQNSKNESLPQMGCLFGLCFLLKQQSPTDSFVFVSLTQTFHLSLFALHSQTSLPTPTSPPSCISTARCPPQPRYSHQDHLSQPTCP